MLQSLDRALSILEFLSKRKSVSITEIAEKFKIDKSSATRIMQTFAAHDIVAKDEFTQKYRMSSGTLQLSFQVFLNNRITQISHPVLQELAKITNETARLCAINRDYVYILDQVDFRRSWSPQNADIPGTRKPFHCSAIGKVMMAYMPPEDARELLGRLERKRYNENTICSIDLLMDQLCQIRKQGYALNQAEYADRAYCVAVPVFDESGNASYSIGFSGMVDYRRQPERFEQIVTYMKKAASRLTERYCFEVRNNQFIM